MTPTSHPRLMSHVSVVLVFAAMASLELMHGFQALTHWQEAERSRAADTVAGWAQRQGALIESGIEETRHILAFLASTPRARAVAGAEQSPAELAALGEEMKAAAGLIDHLRSLQIFDHGGRQLLGLARSQGAVELLPTAQLAQQPILEPRPSARAPRATQEPICLGIFDSADGIRVLRFETWVGGASPARALLIAECDARPILATVVSYSRPGGAYALLVDGDGNYVTPVKPPATTFLADHPGRCEQLLHGSDRVETDLVDYFAAPAARNPVWRLVVVAPHESLSAAVAGWGQYLKVVGPYMVLAVMIGVWGWLVLEMSMRAVRLSEAQRYAERIEKESQKYHALMEGAADMILIVDAKSETVRECNALAREGLSIDKGTRLDALAAGRDLEILRAALSRALAAGGKAVSMPEMVAGSAQVPVDGRLAAIRFAEDEVVEVSLRDLSEKKELEHQLQISERLSMLGMMTAGVAHEINNPLEGIGNYLTLLSRESTPPEKRQRYIESVRHGFDRIRDIVAHFSSMVRPEPERETARLRSRSTDLSQVVASALKLLSHTQNLKDVAVKCVGLGQPLEVAGDAAQLEQVFWNLLLNAGKAMGGHGHITITARRIASSERGLQQIEVTVDDEGPGIPAEYLGRIFDPFFTRSQGSGLGLFVSYGILKAHGGSLTAENLAPAPGGDESSDARPGGARFTLRLFQGRTSPEES